MNETTEISDTLRHTWPDSDDVEIALKVSRPPDNSESNPGFVWLGGFRSDMSGTKADAMVAQAAQLNCASLRFDYSGHGESGGEFKQGTISRWVDESLTVFLNKTRGPQILVGSSMGAWIALRMTQELTSRDEDERIAGLILIAPAPDFTSELMEPGFTTEHKTSLQQQGYIEQSSAYSDEPEIITQNLIEDGRRNLVLDKDLPLTAPVRILQGMADEDVPYTHALRLVEALACNSTMITLVKDGDHRLSRPEDIQLLTRSMSAMVDSSGNSP